MRFVKIKPNQNFSIIILLLAAIVMLFNPAGENSMALASDTNAMVINGGFEDGILSPWTTDFCALDTGTYYKHTGLYGLCLGSYSNVTFAYSPAYITQTFPSYIVVNTTTTLKFWFRCSGSDYARSTIIYSDNSFITQDYSSASGTWAQQTVTLSVGKYISAITFERMTTSGNTIAMDDIVISQATIIAGDLLNGGFEDGTYSPWTTDYGDIDSQTIYVHSGIYGFSLSHYTGSYSPAHVTQSFSGSIPVLSSTSLTFWIKIYGSDSARTTVFYSAGLNITQDYSSTGGAWVQQTFPLTVGKYITAIRFERLTSSATLMALDDVVLSKGVQGITNGDFEIGSLAPWTTVNCVVDTGAYYVHAGNYGTCLGNYSSGIYYPDYITQSFTIPVFVDTITALNFWCCIISPDSARITVTYSDSSVTTQDYSTTGGSWGQLSTTLTLGKSITSVTFERLTTSANAIAIDDIVLVTTDTTAPMINGVIHNPFNPTSDDTVTISASVNDISGIQYVKCDYRIDSGGWNSVTMINNGTYEVILGPFAANSVIEYYILAADCSFEHNIATADNGGSCYSFTVTAPADMTPPSITSINHIPVNPLPINLINITASVTDPSGIESVTLYYQINSGGWGTMAMTFYGGLYRCAFNPMMATTVVNYYIVATDNSTAHNVATADNGGLYYSFTISIPDRNQLQDGDFEKGNLVFDWVYSNAVLDTGASYKHSGVYGCALGTIGPYSPGFINQTFTKPIYVYPTTSLTFWLRNYDTSCQVTIVYTDSSSSSQDFTSTGGVWTQQIVTLSTGFLIKSIQFERTTTTANSLGIDDIVLYKGDSWLYNGDFESLNLAWTFDNACIDSGTTYVYTGSIGCALGMGGPYNPGSINQTFIAPILVNSSMQITFWLRNYDTLCQVTLAYSDGIVTTQNFSSSGGSWVQQSVTLIVGKSMQSIKFERLTTTANACGVDDIKIITIVPDTTPPSITAIAHTPADPTPTNTITITATVIDTSGIFNVMLSYRLNGNSWTNVTMTISGNTYSATIGPFPLNSNVQYFIRASDNSPSKNLAIANNGGSYYGFGINEVIDTSPPTISSVIHSPSNPTHADSITIMATVTDASGIQTVTLYYRVNGGLWIPMSMILNGNSATATIGPFDAGDDIQYYITAKDNYNNIGTQNNNGAYYSFTVMNEQQSSTTEEETFTPWLVNPLEMLIFGSIIVMFRHYRK